jgi:hypothetical protein
MDNLENCDNFIPPSQTYKSHLLLPSAERTTSLLQIHHNAVYRNW